MIDERESYDEVTSEESDNTERERIQKYGDTLPPNDLNNKVMNFLKEK